MRRPLCQIFSVFWIAMQAPSAAVFVSERTYKMQNCQHL
jgi:hypothetical protein